MDWWARALWRVGLVALLGLTGLTGWPAPASAGAVATLALDLVPRGAALHPDTGRLYVTGSGHGGRVLVIDGRGALDIRVIEVGGCPAGVAVDAAAGHVIVADACGARVWVLDEDAEQVLAEVPIAGPAWDVAVDAAAGRVYALRWDGVGQVFVIAGPSWRQVATITVAPDPWAMVVDAVGGIVVTHADGGLTAIDGRRATVAPAVTTGLTGAPAPATLDTTGRLIVAGRDLATGIPRVAAFAGAGGTVAPPGGHIMALATAVRPGQVWGCSGGNAPVAWLAEPATGTVAAVTPLASGCAAVAVDTLTGRRFAVGQVGRAAVGLLTVVDGATPDCPVDTRPGRPPACLA